MREVPEFAPDLHLKTTRDARTSYILSELIKMKEAGRLSIGDILLGGSPGSASLALELLSNREDGIVPANYAPCLRIMKGKVPVDRDPQGRKLPENEIGKVLVVKLGNKEFKTGKDRSIAERTSRDLYKTVRVTHEANFYSLTEAVHILKQWGDGLANEVSRQIVEEVFETKSSETSKEKVSK